MHGAVQDQMADNLARALADQAEANKIQAAANDKYAAGFKSLAIILERMESKMAREDTQATMSERLKEMEINLKSVLESQDAGFGLVAEVVRLSAQLAAKSNPEKVEEILYHIRQKIGPKLGPIAQKGIAPE